MMKKRMTKLVTAGGLMAAVMLLCALTAFAGQWVKDGTGWWFQNSDGSYPRNGLYTIAGKDYAFNESGYMIENAWYQSPDTGRWYYATGSGELAVNQWIQGKYYVGPDGNMLTNSWIDGYYVGADGAWDPSKDEQNLSGSAYDLYSSAYYADLTDVPDGSNDWSAYHFDDFGSTGQSQSADDGSSSDDGRKSPFNNNVSAPEEYGDEDIVTQKTSTN